MKSDLTSLEAQLRELRAVPLDDELFARLEAAADDSLVELTPDEQRFEQRLRANPPAALSADFMASLEGIVRDVPFHEEKVIVPFPHARPVAAKAHRKRPMWAAAAAVALIGAASALLMPSAKTTTRLASQPPPPGIAPVGMPANNSAANNLVPASFNSGVSEVHDEGVIWKSNHQPHSLVRVVYKDKMSYKAPDGRTYQIEQPRVEYMLVPAKTD